MRPVPFRSEAQRRYLWAKEPALAREWTAKYGAKPRPKRLRKTKTSPRKG